MQHSALLTREPPNMDIPVSTSDEGASSHGSQDHWGYTLETKREKTVHIVFQNIAGLPKDPEASDMKLDLTRWWITQNKIDIFGCIELGKCWDLIEYSQCTTKNPRMVGGSPMKSRLQLIRATPWGGSTGGDWHSSFNQLAHHAQKAGDDPSGLGWWSWIRLKGKGTQITRIIAVYHPCSLDGPLSTYQQHCCGLAKLHRSKCQWQAILNDLEQELLK